MNMDDLFFNVFETFYAFIRQTGGGGDMQQR